MGWPCNPYYNTCRYANWLIPVRRSAPLSPGLTIITWLADKLRLLPGLTIDLYRLQSIASRFTIVLCQRSKLVLQWVSQTGGVLDEDMQRGRVIWHAKDITVATIRLDNP